MTDQGKILREKTRFCLFYKCVDCPLGTDASDCVDYFYLYSEEAAHYLMYWAKEHPDTLIK
jgi:hypothetical protein